MMESLLEFEDLSFKETEEGIRVLFWDLYWFLVNRAELEEIGPYKIDKKDPHKIRFEASEKRARNKLNLLVMKGMNQLRNRLTGRKTIYLTLESGIPLIGNGAFGLVDRNTSLIEVKPATGCNLSCVFCSVDEGPKGRWATDFIVEPGYLVEEFAKLAKFKGVELEAHIGTHGEPLLYTKIVELVEGLASIPNVKRISFDTNGTLLTRQKIDRLADAGLTRIHLSLNALEQETAVKLAGCPYNLKHVLEMARYASKKGMLLIAPIWVPGLNDAEIPKLIGFAKELGVPIAIQNFLSYKYGRNPVKSMGWEAFEENLKRLEAEQGIKLLFTEHDFNITKTKELPRPFRKGQVIKAQVMCEGRLPGEKLAVALGRSISVPNCPKKGLIRVKITRDKHNIFYGACLR